MNKVIKKGLKIVVYISLFVLLFFIALLFLFIANKAYGKLKHENPYFDMYAIASPSMVPTINVNDVILIKKEKTYREGDIITFRSQAINTGGYTVTHRIEKIIYQDNKKIYITKGDNNAEKDLGYISSDDILGKVIFVIPKLGYIQSFLKSKIGWFIVILIPTLLIIVIDIKKLVDILSLKEEMNKVNNVKNTLLYQEKEENKKYIALIDRAVKINKK